MEKAINRRNKEYNESLVLPDRPAKHAFMEEASF